MRHSSSLVLVAVAVATIVLSAGRAAAEPDLPGSKDHPLLTRMPGYSIHLYEQRDFDRHELRDAKLAPFTVEGRLTYIGYTLQPGAHEPSRTEVLRNYESAITRIGGTVLYSDWDGVSFLQVKQGGSQYWIEVSAYITSQYFVWIIEKQAMTQSVVASAEALAGDLARTGHAAVYGIYFDTGKAVLKPESKQAIGEMAKVLAADPRLSLYVVGHTDNVGTIEANLKLSRARAEAVVKAMVTEHKVAAARLQAHGVASLAPVAPNDTEDGRARNRRVELVRR